MPEKERSRLARDFDVLSLPPDPDLPAPVADHPDMIFAEVGGTLFFSRRYRDAFPAAVEELCRRTGLPVILSDVPRSARYPFDVGCNALVWKRRDAPVILAGRLDALFPEIPAYAKACGFECVHVRQGYAACSCIALPDALLTSDDGIRKTLLPHDEHVYLVPNEGIRLPGYGNGFLGGASGAYAGGEETRVYFCGDPSVMEYDETLSRLLDRFRAEPVLLSDEPLTDRGGIRFFRQINSEEQHHV